MNRYHRLLGPPETGGILLQSWRMLQVADGQQRHDAAGIEAELHIHRSCRLSRRSWIACRTCSPVTLGVPGGGTATSNPDLRTSLTGLRTGSISTFPSRYAISNGAPGLSPADSRTAFGITTRPALSMVDLMALVYHQGPPGKHS